MEFTRCDVYQLYASHHLHSLRQHPSPADDPVGVPVAQGQLHHGVHRQLCVQVF